ncbi:hypothetical protein FRACYDRAFT_241717 [Fragilariopsis cylindrus CCMP1102]|uniref:Uncharacterized protein n=1 Tax=Fragilariopsis cylindrus CCMP1102 TaxID=635003 RepID=A0A1E7F5B3_9STRA|nr:hypothetical protein FRACYDRAFT_241717 [Fragilariopsis cylindrus CCMP1102]|eukprot:OEU13381.1 hypothetical protein FRACYDRAFT_241717 [Fragilariopsis cylindrus CCMP1102]
MKKTAGLESSVVVFVIAAVFVLEWRVTHHMVDALSTYDGRGGVTEKTISLGTEEKKISIFVPGKASKEDDVQSGTRIMAGNDGGSSNFALSQLIAHYPSLVEERNVLELGCGLGMVTMS